MIPRRRAFLRAVGAACAAAPRVLRAQGASVPRVAILTPVPSANVTAFLEGMKERGYADGRNATIATYSADGDFERLPALAAQIVRSRPDVIVAFVTQASIAAKHATSTIPIVAVGIADPVAAGVLADLARPGGNVTGTAGQSSAVIGKQLDLIRDLRPGAARVDVIWNPANTVFQRQSVDEARAGGKRLGMRMRFAELRAPGEFAAAVANVATDRPDAVLVLSDPLFVAHAQPLARLLIAHRLAAVSGSRPMALGGLLATYGPDLADAARRAATYVDKILRGARPGEMPVELATRFELLVNLGTARALGIPIPSTLLARADEVIP